MNKSDFETAWIDGELFLLPTEKQMERLLSGDIAEGMGLHAPELVAREYDKFRKVKGNILFGLHNSAPTRGGWWPCCLVLYKEELVRVHLEFISCKHCNWSGYSANPTEFDIYIGSPNRDEARQKGYSRTQSVKCPKCSSKLSRPSIWIQ